MVSEQNQQANTIENVNPNALMLRSILANPNLSPKFKQEQVIKYSWFMKIGYEPHPKQTLYHNSSARFRLANCGRRFGKAEAITNEIPMADGSFKIMRDIKPGDFVLGPDGKPTRVIATTPIFLNQKCAKVVFNDHTEIVVNKEHLWSVVDKNSRKAITEINTRRIYNEQTLTTAEMQKRVHYGSRNESNYAVKLAQPVKYMKQDLPVDPYLIGLWLGDGAASGVSITTADDEILEYLINEGFTYKKSSTYTYYVHGLRQALAQIYVFDYIDDARNTKSLVGDKFVPNVYLNGSIAQRLALLQGLMDTDGTIGKNGHCQFTSTTKQLADSVELLVNSLGMKTYRYERRTSYTYKDEKLVGKKSYTIHFYPLMNVFRLSRKLERIPVVTSIMQNYRFITDIIDIESVPTKCITVEREDGLYLTSRRYIITHNSHMAAKDLEPKLLHPNKTFWIVGPTYSLGEKEFRVIWQDMIVKLKLGRDPSVEKGYSKQQGNMFIKFKNRNTIIEVKSADNPENLVGDALDGVIMSESAKHKQETWERYIRPALADTRGFADFPTTPEGFNWYYDEWMHGLDAELVDYESWKFPSWENPYVYPGGINDSEILLLKKTMSSESFNQEIGADFGSFVGKIYPEWDVNVHVKAHKFNPLWPNYIAFDWGYANPMAAVEFQISPRDEIYIWRVHYKSHTMLERYLYEMQQREQPEGYHVNLTFGDAADPEAVMTVNTKFGPCIADPKSKTNWRQGIDLVRSFLEREIGQDEYGGPIYGPALFVDPSCLAVIKEFNNYRSPESSKGKNVTEMGIKQDDHALDALRYGLVHIFELGATSSLYEVMGALESPAGLVNSMGISNALGDAAATQAMQDQLDRLRAQLLASMDTGNNSKLPGMGGESALSDSSTQGYFTTAKEF